MAERDPISAKGRKALNEHFAAAGSWAHDRDEALRRSRRIAWIVAGVAIIIAFFVAMALLLITPLKTVVPYTLMVDRQTGYVQLLKPLDPETVSADTALTQSFLVQYVIAREGFDVNSLQSDYRKVALWSAGGARSGYLASVQAANPTSYLATLPRSTVIEVHVKSVSPMEDDVAMVRFDTVRRDINGQISAPQPWVSVIRYRYSGEPMTIEDRFINPLGFQVTKYRRSQEALPVVQPVTAEAIEDEPEIIALPRQTPGPRVRPSVARNVPSSGAEPQ